MTTPWTDEYLVGRYEADWLSTGNYHYERKKFGRTPPGKYAAWNKMVSALSDLDRHPRDTQHATARLIMGMHRPQWEYDTDEETGLSVVVVGMCLLAQYLGGQGLPAKVDNRGCGIHLMFSEERCTDSMIGHLRCEGIVADVRKLHAKLLESPQTVEIPGDVRMSEYR